MPVDAATKVNVPGKNPSGCRAPAPAGMASTRIQARPATTSAVAVLSSVNIQATVSAAAARDSSASIGASAARGFCFFFAATPHHSGRLEPVGMDRHIAAAVEDDLEMIAAAPGVLNHFAAE